MIDMEGLRILVTGADGKASVKDRAGTEHNLSPLNLFDLIEFEKSQGRSVFEMLETVKITEIAFLLYLSLRKDNLSREDIRAKRFKISEEDVYEMFDFSVLKEILHVYNKIMAISGLELTKPEPEGSAGNPPPAEPGK